MSKFIIGINLLAAMTNIIVFLKYHNDTNLLVAIANLIVAIFVTGLVLAVKSTIKNNKQ